MRGDAAFRLWRAGRLTVTNSCGKNWSGMVSECCLLTFGENVAGEEEKFSLSSDDKYPVKGSLGVMGLVGVGGMSSERSEAVVETLSGVVTFDDLDLTGVIGRGSAACRTKRPPSK